MTAWRGKEDRDQDGADAAETSENAGGNDAIRLNELTDKMTQLGKMLDQTSRQVVEYLVRRQPQAEDNAGAEAGALSEKLDALAEKIDRMAAGGADCGTVAKEPADSFNQALTQLRDGVGQQLSALADGIRRLEGNVAGGLQSLTAMLQPPEPQPKPEPVPAGPASSGDWQRIIFGAELAEHPELDFQRRQLLDGMVQGDPGACSLIGQLLVFRSAMTEKMPPLLKEIGEAYYRWQPKTRPPSNKMEEVLVDWLKETIHDAGIANTIELVHAGERFDSTRHTAASRGVEITEVHGWIVLRDNGRVYTKASVSVK